MSMKRYQFRHLAVLGNWNTVLTALFS